MQELRCQALDCTLHQCKTGQPRETSDPPIDALDCGNTLLAGEQRSDQLAHLAPRLDARADGLPEAYERSPHEPLASRVLE